jgi:poly(3-hydroxybutyrate) depolymerase
MTASFSKILRICLIVGSTLSMVCAEQDAVKGMAVPSGPKSLFFGKEPIKWNSLLHFPSAYSGSTKKWPMILYLHGETLRGNDLNLIKRNGPPSFLDRTPEFPFVVVSPQLGEGQEWEAESLLNLVDFILNKYRVDPDRVYLTGVSKGAEACWELAAMNQMRFACLVPLCGSVDESLAPKLNAIPIWAFHGDQDKVAHPARHQRLVESINKLGGKAQFTLIPEGTHGSIIYDTYQRKDLYEWMQVQTRSQVVPPEPVVPDPVPAPPALDHKEYVVKKGDNLWRISQNHKVSLEDLKTANHLKSNIIKIGQRLIIPVP